MVLDLLWALFLRFLALVLEARVKVLLLGGMVLGKKFRDSFRCPGCGGNQLARW